MKFILSQDEVWLNVDHIRTLEIEYLGEEYTRPWQVVAYIKDSGEYVIIDFQERDEHVARGYLNSLIKQINGIDGKA